MAKRVRDLISELSQIRNVDIPDELNRLIEIPEVNRVGLELTGFFQYYEPKRIIILGNKEFAYLNQISSKEIENCFEFLLQDKTPCLITTRSNEASEIINEIAVAKNVPILHWEGSTSSLLLELYSILDRWFAPKKLVSGTLMQINGKGILIKGPSGIGKSEIALELIRRNHTLISDDSVEISRIDNKLVGKAPDLIKNMIEIRGVGILDITQLFGHSIIGEYSEIDYVIELSKWDKKLTYERVGNNKLSENILDVSLEKVVLPVSEGRSMAEVIEVCVTNFKLQERGINGSNDFATRVENLLKEKNNV